MDSKEEKTLDDEVDELKENVAQLTYDVKAEREERRYEANEIRVDIDRLRLEKKEWERVREGAIEMEQLERELNRVIGMYWWKPYIGGVFWSNVSTPLNISISILSLLTAGQGSLSNFIPTSVSTTISFTLFLLSLVNTFFTPHSRIIDSTTQINTWKEFATRFEKLYYSGRQSDEEVRNRLAGYRELMVDLKEYISETPDKQNLFIDFLYSTVSCVKKADQWMEISQKEKI